MVTSGAAIGITATRGVIDWRRELWAHGQGCGSVTRSVESVDTVWVVYPGQQVAKCVASPYVLPNSPAAADSIAAQDAADEFSDADGPDDADDVPDWLTDKAERGGAPTTGEFGTLDAQDQEPRAAWASDEDNAATSSESDVDA